MFSVACVLLIEFRSNRCQGEDSMLKISKVAALWPLSTSVALAALATSAEAAVLNVCHQGCKYSTIQSAVNAAASGDQISIAKGIYTENVSIDGKTLVLVGAGSAVTIVDGSAAVSPVFTLGSTVNPEPTWHHITLQGLTIGDRQPRHGERRWCCDQHSRWTNFRNRGLAD
jgi:pectin methylesterase-like acyl-CoA thioesterase